LIGNELESGQSKQRGPGWTPLGRGLQCLCSLDLCLVESRLPPVSADLLSCHSIFIAYMLQVSPFQKISENRAVHPMGVCPMKDVHRVVLK
jgi:hypothetical protein